MKKKLIIAISAIAVLAMASCFGGKETMANGGELTGSTGRAFAEPAPYGMVLVSADT